jgi:hypothetical protein
VRSPTVAGAPSELHGHGCREFGTALGGCREVHVDDGQTFDQFNRDRPALVQIICDPLGTVHVPYPHSEAFGGLLNLNSPKDCGPAPPSAVLNRLAGASRHSDSLRNLL